MTSITAAAAGANDLFAVRGGSISEEHLDEVRIVVNVASKEYSRCIEQYLQPGDTFLTCVFGELSGGRVVQKGTYAKMARGEMVRYMAEHQIQELEKLKGFDRLDYAFSEIYSTEREYVFLRKPTA